MEFVLAEALGGEYRTRLATLDAVAGGATKLEQMASHAGVKAASLPPYIRDLTELLHVLTRFRGGRITSLGTGSTPSGSGPYTAIET